MTTIRTISLDNKDPTRVVLDALRNSLDDGAVTWMHLSVQATMSSGAADDVGSKAKASGMETTVTDL